MPWDRSHRRSAAPLHGISSNIFFLSRPSAVAAYVINTSIAAINVRIMRHPDRPRRNGDVRRAANHPQASSRMLVTSIRKGPGYLGVLSGLEPLCERAPASATPDADQCLVALPPPLRIARAAALPARNASAHRIRKRRPPQERVGDCENKHPSRAGCLARSGLS